MMRGVVFTMTPFTILKENVTKLLHALQQSYNKCKFSTTTRYSDD